jgi:hypothetical protein
MMIGGDRWFGIAAIKGFVQETSMQRLEHSSNSTA